MFAHASKNLQYTVLDHATNEQQLVIWAPGHPVIEVTSEMEDGLASVSVTDPSGRGDQCFEVFFEVDDFACYYNVVPMPAKTGDHDVIVSHGWRIEQKGVMPGCVRIAPPKKSFAFEIDISKNIVEIVPL